MGISKLLLLVIAEYCRPNVYCTELVHLSKSVSPMLYYIHYGDEKVRTLKTRPLAINFISETCCTHIVSLFDDIYVVLVEDVSFDRSQYKLHIISLSLVSGEWSVGKPFIVSQRSFVLNTVVSVEECGLIYTFSSQNNMLLRYDIEKNVWEDVKTPFEGKVDIASCVANRGCLYFFEYGTHIHKYDRVKWTKHKVESSTRFSSAVSVGEWIVGMHLSIRRRLSLYNSRTHEYKEMKVNSTDTILPMIKYDGTNLMLIGREILPSVLITFHFYTIPATSMTSTKIVPWKESRLLSDVSISSFLLMGESNYLPVLSVGKMEE